MKKYGGVLDTVTVLFRLPVHSDKTMQQKPHRGREGSSDEDSEDEGNDSSPLLCRVPGQAS